MISSYTHANRRKISHYPRQSRLISHVRAFYLLSLNGIKGSKERPRSFHRRARHANPAKDYRAIVQLLADPDARIEHIAQRHRVSTHTVRAIRAREAVAIAERKQRLMSIFANVAEISAERMEQLAGQASLRDAGITSGIATDKLLALSGDSSLTQTQQNLHLHLQSTTSPANGTTSYIPSTRSNDAPHRSRSQHPPRRWSSCRADRREADTENENQGSVKRRNGANHFKKHLRGKKRNCEKRATSQTAKDNR